MITTRKCKSCQKKLHRDIWNSKVDVLTCQNDFCPLFRQPQGYIPEPRNAKLFPQNVSEVISAATEAQRDRRAREAKIQMNDDRPYKSRGTLLETSCENCGARIIKPSSVLARAKHHFCARICWQEYRQTHRIEGKNNP